jgi:hypothetical protein
VNRQIIPAAVFTALTFCAGAWASYPCGIYARIDQVEVGPNEDKPEWIKIRGDFLLVKTSNRVPDPNDPQRGFLYFSIVKGKEDLCRAEWADLKKLAADRKGECYVAFGSAHTQAFTDEKVLSPEDRKKLLEHDDKIRVHAKGDLDPKDVAVPHPVNHGLTRLRTERAGESDRASEQDKQQGVNRNPVVLLQAYLKTNPVNKQ